MGEITTDNAPQPAEPTKPKSGFPRKYALVNALMVVLSAVLELDPFRIILAGVGLLIFSFIVIVLQKIIHLIFSRWVKGIVFWRVVIFLPALFFWGDGIYWTYYFSLPSTKIDRVLTDGRFAELPRGAKEVKVFSWDGMFTGGQYLRFSATPEAIHAFVITSQSLKGISPVEYSQQHQHLTNPDGTLFDSSGKTEYFVPSPMTPVWFNEELKDRGRLYEVPGDARGHNYGRVIIDDMQNRVYIYIEWS